MVSAHTFQTIDTSLPTYQIEVYSPVTGALLRVIDPADFFEISYTRKLNDVGSIAFTLPYTAEFESLFQLDYLVDVHRENPDTGLLNKDETYFVRYIERFRQGADERLVIGGFSVMHLLDRRLIDPDDDPNAAAGFSAKTGAADVVMRSYALEQLGTSASVNRQAPDFEVFPVAGVGDPVFIKKGYDRLLKVLQELGDAGNMDFHCDRIAGRIIRLTIERIGQDKRKSANYPGSEWVGLDPDRGNLQSPSLILDRKKEKNTVYGLGEGDGANRRIVKLTSAAVSDSPFNRIEFVKDAKNSEQADNADLQTEARAALRENAVKTKLEFTVGGAIPGNTYKRDWDLGDKVTVEWGLVSRDVRITEVDISLDDNGEGIAVTVEDVEQS